ncbi:MAG TPA: alpha/beta fold hydrolase [Solirubrobacteraceae bacterium]|nr:alpha/beta fold hydrolase [Solirubrobacteraceae bacterium]
MIERVPVDGDYGLPAEPDWRETDWSQHTHDAVIAERRVRYLDVGPGASRSGSATRKSASSARPGELCFVLVHGMGGRWKHWLECIPALAEHARVLALDLPGFGASQSPAGGASLDGFADTAAELAHSLGIERVVLVGHSMGGPIAIRFAARHPELAQAIVLVAGAVFQFSALLGLREVLRFAVKRPGGTAAIAMEIATAGLPAPAVARQSIVRVPLLRQLFLAPYVRNPSAFAADTAHLIVDGAGAPGVLPTAYAIGRSDPREGIELVRCPILLLAGDSDRISPLPDTEAFQREVPQAQTVVLEGCGHMLMLERPRAVNAQLLAFARALA